MQFSCGRHDKLRVRAERFEIRIRDDGTGIPPEAKDKMFNPFFTTKPAGFFVAAARVGS